MNLLDQVSELKSLQGKASIPFKFRPDLEVSYVNWLRNKQQSNAFKVMLVFSIVWGFFLLADILRLYGKDYSYRDLPMFDLVITIRLFVLVALMLISLVVKKSQSNYNPNPVIAAYFFLAIATGVLSNIYHEQGQYHSAWFPIVSMVPLFTLPIGMLFFQAIKLGSLVFVGLVTCHFIQLGALPNSQLGVFSAILFICLISGGAGGYFQEKSFRAAFVAIKLLELKTFTDPMTDLGNRRCFTSIGGKLLQDAKRSEEELSFAIIDLDNFKSINDTYGHDFGDHVLTKFSHELKLACRRPLDLPVRLGGEEFGIVFKDTYSAAALSIITSLLKKFNATQFDYQGQELANLTAGFSAGITQLREGDTLQSMYKRADILLYEAKMNGKNQILQD